MALQRNLCCLAVFITCFSSFCTAVHNGLPHQVQFSGFHAGLKTSAALLVNSSSVLKGYISLKDGIFAVDITVAVLSGEVTLKYGGVYFLTTTVHYSTKSNDTCNDTAGTVKVAICVDSDCSNNASLQAIRQTCDKVFSMTATGLLLLRSKQIVRVHLSNTGNSSLVIGAASTFSGYLLA